MVNRNQEPRVVDVPEECMLKLRRSRVAVTS